MSILNILFFDPFLNLLILLFTVFGHSMGWAIIGLTILFRLVVLPLNWKSLHSQRKMQQLKPHLDVLKDKHGKDKIAYSQAQMNLYKEHGVSPVGGCLPMLLQLPFLFGVYQAMSFVIHLKNVGDLNDRLYVDWLHINQLSDLHFQFGFLNLAESVLILAVLAGISQFVLSKMMLPPADTQPKPETKKEASLEQSMASAQRQMVYFFPIMTFIISWQFPGGLALYWTVGNLFSIIQQFYVNRALPHSTDVPVMVVEENLIESESKKKPKTKAKPKKAKRK